MADCDRFKFATIVDFSGPILFSVRILHCCIGRKGHSASFDEKVRGGEFSSASHPERSEGSLSKIWIPKNTKNVPENKKRSLNQFAGDAGSVVERWMIHVRI